MYRSLFDFLNTLERSGELIRVKTEVDPVGEIPEIASRIFNSGNGKAVLFENTGSQFPVAMNLFGSDRRMAMALGQPSLQLLARHIQELADSVLAPKDSLWHKLSMLPLLADAARWLPKKSSSRGACQQVIYSGQDVNLNILPVLKCWPADGGRFITLPMVHTVDPDTGTANVGMYRIQIFSQNTVGLHWHRHKTGAKHFDACRRVGKPMPVSICVGGDPVYTYVATAPLPDGLDEYLLAGFLRGKPVRLVKSVTNDIYVPADCDFVIEGFVDPHESSVPEGPFGDHTGFYSLQDLYPMLHVTALTHRRNAVWPATVVGIPPQEDFFISKATEKIFLTPMRVALLPELHDLYMPPQGVSHNLAVISLKVRYPGHVKQAVSSMWGAGQMMFNKYLIVAPHDVDIRNTQALAELIRGVDFGGSIVRGDGVLDVLDHAVAETGVGGKLALDLTSAIPAEPLPLPDIVSSAGGVSEWCADLYSQWGIIMLFADPQQTVDIGAFLDANNIGRAVCVILDRRARRLLPTDWLWLALANTDPGRDVVIAKKSLIADARTKIPGKPGFPVRFPNVTVASDRIISLVDSRWDEYGVGDFVESPSLRYKSLSMGDEAEISL